MIADVSVIIPAYLARETIGDALSSVKAPFNVCIEIIVVDDGSNDNTSEVVRLWSEKNGIDVRIIRQDNSGQASARNRGAKEATGEWLAFLDADDTWKEEKLERQWNVLNEVDADVVFASTTHFLSNESSSDELVRAIPSFSASLRSGMATADSLFLHNYIATSSVLVKKSLFRDLGGFDEAENLRGVEDYELWLKMAVAGGNFIGVEQPLVNYRVGHESSSSRLCPMAEGRFIVLSRYKDIVTANAHSERRIARVELDLVYATAIEYGYEKANLRKSNCRALTKQRPEYWAFSPLVIALRKKSILLRFLRRCWRRVPCL